MNYLGAAVFTVVLIGSLADSNHRAIFAQSFDADTGDIDAIYFSTAGLANQTLVIFPADHSLVHCSAVADYLAHGDGTAELAHEGFTAVECDGHEEAIKENQMQDNGRTTKLRGDMIRKKLPARNPDERSRRAKLNSSQVGSS
jgi:hypothetical protein